LHTIQQSDAAGSAVPGADPISIEETEREMRVSCMQLTERTQRAVQRYVRFIEAIPHEQVAPLLPSLADLRLRFEVGPECAMPLLRPVIRRALQGWDPEDSEIDLSEAKEATNGGARGVAMTAFSASLRMPFVESLWICAVWFSSKRCRAGKM
jgi:hypothetical protein